MATVKESASPLSASSVRAPGPASWLPGGQLFHFRRDPLQFMTNLRRDYGDVARFRIGPQGAFLLGHPDYIRDVLVTNQESFVKGRALQRAKRLLGEGLLTSENPLHRRQRRLAQPAFHRQRIAAYADVMVACADRISARWQDEQTLDIAREMSLLTMAIIGKTFFDHDVEAEADEIGAALTEIMRLFQMLMLPYSELLERLPLPANRRFRQARERFDELIYRMIREHRRSGDRGDLLSMLLSAQDEETGGAGMSDEQVRDEALTIFLAGHETTANALAWTWYLLAQHAEVEAKLHDEVDRVWKTDAQLSAASVSQLPYTEMVLTEAMRLYPPAWVLGRLAVKDTEVGGYAIPVGSLVLMSQWVVQRDERYFPDPLRFLPERWTAEARTALPQFAYFPFGGGARRCIGENFAWTEGVLLIAALGKDWRFKFAQNQKIETQPRITLRPKNGIQMILERR
ncbi:MAG: cytochrome P450 [Pyrinomonadaceae bacterium]|nr:cytochrome P450 [Pyrinomonadaceae bacterium]